MNLQMMNQIMNLQMMKKLKKLMIKKYYLQEKYNVSGEL